MRFIAPARSLAVLVALACALPAPAAAQVGSSTDIILGRVSGPEGSPVEGARVEVTSTETGITRRKTTDAQGHYSILFPDGGGSYTLRVTFLGFAPFTRSVARQADEDRLVADVRLSRNPQVLGAVQVRASGARDVPDRPTAGSTERTLSSAQLDRLPVEKGDLNAVASLTPGVVATAATDSTPAAFSVVGQPATQNQITLDGLSFSSGQVPAEAIRSTRVITSTYDVSRGQFTGGQIASTTRSGTNTPQGVVTYALRDPELEFLDESSALFGQKYQQNSLNLGAGGPLREDQAFAFGAASVSRRTNPLQSLLAANAQTLARLGASADSVNRFLTRLGALGVAPTLPGIPADRLNDQASAILRLDGSVGEAHTLTLRGDWRGSLQDATRISSFAVPSTGGNLRTLGGGIMATLTSHLGSFINEGRLYQSSDRSNTVPYLDLPVGRVTVGSTLATGAQSFTTLQFGGNPALPQAQHSRLFEASDELSWVSGDGAHRVKLGALVNDDRSTIGTIPNRYGTFVYRSLADFDANRPAQFTRTISGRERLAGSNNVALYVGDAWRPAPALQLTYGVRLEGSRFPNTPDYNPVVEQLFGRRTDRTPRELHASPRAGFTYFVGLPSGAGRGDGATADGRPRGTGGPPFFGQVTWIIRGGAGEFRGRIPSSLVAAAVDATGLPGGQSQLSCIGPAVPTPDWAAYLADPATIPTQCAPAEGGAPSAGADPRRNVTLFDNAFGAPRVWRTSLGASRRFRERYNFSVDASLAYGVKQTSATDLNLDPTARFTLASESQRPVFTPAAAIVPRTGTTSILASRLHPELASVSEIGADFRSLSTQLTVSAGGITLQGISLAGSYTFVRARDQRNGFNTGGGFAGYGGATTAGNPNVAEWGTSDLERRHSFFGLLTFPARPWLDLTAIARVTAGQRYTPVVGGDVNGDGAFNDRAQVFDPAAARLAGDTAVANGMSRLLGSASGAARACLLSQLGTIADRNSCSAPWSPALDLQLNIKPDQFGLGRRLTLSLQLQNTLVGLDQLLHGSSLRGWGQPIFPDRTLLYVRGFDASAQRFIYQVNEHFGTPSGANSAYRVPFQIGLQARMSLGQDPARQQFRRIFAGENGQPPTRDEFKARLARIIPDPFQGTIALDDSLALQLTPEQRARLGTLSAALAPRVERLAGEIADVLASGGSAPDPAVIGARLVGKTNEARKLAEQAVADLRATLTPAQWEKLPERFRTVPVARGFGPLGGGGGFERHRGP